MSERQGKLERSIARILSETIPELSDPRVPMIVTVERVRLSTDLTSARVLVSAFGDDVDEADMLSALNRASGLLQRSIARELKLRNTPKLSFYTEPREVL
ncbi:MAG: 30S ribosome-binding factor RbfA [Trueperaceae bacterium]|nr:30S ribosome-binding factor RbfA [Trueperaceae bacterium]